MFASCFSCKNKSLFSHQENIKAIYFARFYVVETLKDWYREGDPKKSVPKPLVGIFGGIAGAASVLGNTPLDVIKTRMQSLDAAKYKNTWDCAKYV